ncbi:hypothetical protein DICPUDRAFT_154497 [Dictyostelium purpureum]|uniref:Uncharacterized protein n=1 Tax=Dictyostelium purpureum TaxID=5786 RepID=F0ZRH4_DICPU|nr:uncharacterized protein DICPUDRAFT_154497 [Dictyostelium purpureum]EGC33442.1 hypothetical protein DICPUDRAFT_154497 [Dictyostelium purpureum]|eukprot:XP_003290013.1 hypothetical protein DICPUDRAFT_154497 [Dictyostelium purpureum]
MQDKNGKEFLKVFLLKASQDLVGGDLFIMDFKGDYKVIKTDIGNDKLKIVCFLTKDTVFEFKDITKGSLNLHNGYFANILIKIDDIGHLDSRDVDNINLDGNSKIKEMTLFEIKDKDDQIVDDIIDSSFKKVVLISKKFEYFKDLLENEDIEKKEFKQLNDSSYYHQCMIETPINIKINNMYLSIPCLKEQLYEICSSFGKNIYNNVWEIDKNLIKIGNDGGLYLEREQSLINKVKEGLGIYKDENIKIKLKRMLICKNEGYLPYCDIEKQNSKYFGKLFVSVPSSSIGGEFIITNPNNGKNNRINLSNNWGSIFNCVAFYSDCLFTSDPISSGNRVYLEYDMAKSTKRSLSSKTLEQIKSNYENKSEKISEQLDFIFNDKNVPKLVYLLKNKYLMDENLAPQLEGSDFNVVKKIEKVSKINPDLGYCFSNYCLKIESTGSFEIENDEESFKEEECNILENFIHTHRDINYNPINLNQTSISPDFCELLPSQPFQSYNYISSNPDFKKNKLSLTYELPSLVIYKKSLLQKNNNNILSIENDILAENGNSYNTEPPHKKSKST